MTKNMKNKKERYIVIVDASIYTKEVVDMIGKVIGVESLILEGFTRNELLEIYKLERTK